MGDAQPSSSYSQTNAQSDRGSRKEMDVIINARKLLRHSYAKVRNQQTFPKKDRRLADEIFSEALAVVADLTEANEYRLAEKSERERRFEAQRSALRHLRLLIANIELAHDILQGLGENAFSFWAQLAATVKNQAAAWYKSDTRRAASM